ncbi:DUF1007 family protein [Pararhodobacter sp. SW119]|uniref:DUF1007 family protein n=1 Tax=Pararhodobacter sp. SW119 TaxID=2780075 RepID=UPI001AE01473|nr:DUF1007 family protein [Pararhodobacter sp. SW119]
MRGGLAGLVLACAATATAAHPHEFVEARLIFDFDGGGHLQQIGVEWRYDAFTSMLILGDMGIDPAAEALTPEEEAQLSGFDTNWIPGFNGDLWPYFAGDPLPVGPPQAASARLEAGEIVSQHWRRVEDGVDPAAGDLVVQVYDPEYYVSYTISHDSRIEGRGDCRLRFFGPDLSAAEERLQAALDELIAGGAADLEQDFPAVGRDFAEELRFDCTASGD